MNLKDEAKMSDGAKCSSCGSEPASLAYMDKNDVLHHLCDACFPGVKPQQGPPFLLEGWCIVYVHEGERRPRLKAGFAEAQTAKRYAASMTHNSSDRVVAVFDAATHDWFAKI